ncbi:MAG TPA: response regulator transcription factor [Clostridiales bacterium]|nr:MAG: Transcriptional regulatory protein DevR (DosR) [Firmicutes bacterium ADurb.Bin262]HOU09434.1 response regulator transcription factor [Clostridiales bacterium]HQK72270.1 response regulator transcription factor [Clostridiales bacterium]
MINVIIVDDDIESARALRRVIDGREGIVVTDLFYSALEAVGHCLAQKPDLVILDINMPEMDGLEACRRIKFIDPAIKVLMLTFYQIKENEIEAVKCDCDGYLYKGHTGEEMTGIIKSTMMGFSTFDHGVKDTIHSRLTADAEIRVAPADIEKLTDKQKEIIRMLTAGKKDSEIARDLFMSEGYLRNQLMAIRTMLGLRTSKELAVWGARAGL